MDYVNGLFFRNLPDISEQQFKKELIRIFPEVLAAPEQTGSLKVKVFLPRGDLREGVVSGIFADFDNLMDVAESNRIFGKDIIMKRDYGDERDEHGNFKENLAPKAKRAIDQLHGVSHRKVTNVFRKSFWDSINPKVFRGNPGCVHLQSTTISKTNLQLAGLVKYFNRRGKSTKVLYGCILETLQSIRYFNKNSQYGSSVFTDEAGGNESLCTDLKGIGNLGKLLTVNARRTYSVVEFKDLDRDILNPSILSANNSSYCWRCESNYTFIGVQVDLNFTTGICKCDYQSDLDILDPNRALHWKNETFTRLCEGQAAWIIVHQPMKCVYEGSLEYQNIVLPILQEDWKCTSKEFKNANFTVGNLSSVQFVECILDSKGKKHDVFGINVVVPKSDFWSAENVGGFSKVTASIELTKRYTSARMVLDVKGSIKAIVNMSPNEALAKIQICLPEKSAPLSETRVRLTPKPVKSEYNTTKSLIRKLAQNGEHRFCNLFVGPSKQRNWNLNVFHGIIKRPLSSIDSKKSRILSEIRQSLNPEQAAAEMKACRNIVSFLQGPPGTGKTRTLAAIVVRLALLEDSPILACAPSNVAADEIAKRIHQLGGNEVKVLRIFTKSREMNLSWGGGHHESSCPVLHDEVQKSAMWQNDERVRKVAEKFANRDEHCLIAKEKEYYERKVQEIETVIMSEYDVFVSTVGALADKRVEGWSRKDRRINTVVLDEAAKMTHPSVLAVLVVDPVRLVFGGDHKQLMPTVKSYSAASAGLNKSLMEWIYLSRAIHNLPWTLLLEQYRMVPQIRELVSQVSYGGLLRDAPCILMRADFHITKIPQSRHSSILVCNHSHPEEKVGTSYRNKGEASIILEVVQKMLDSAIQPSSITILTMYSAQLKLVKSLDLAQGIEVVNVDGFQGKENRIILLSLVRSNEKGEIGFSSVSNRLNVALSRAQRYLVIVSNPKMFKLDNNQLWRVFNSQVSKLAKTY